MATDKDHNEKQMKMGEFHGEKFAEEELGLKPILLSRHKNNPHGFDAVYRNPKSGNYVVVDFKGGPSSRLETNQKQAAYIIKAADRTLRSRTASLKEKRAALLIKGKLQKGKTIEFLAIKTPSSGKTHISHRSLSIKAANAQSVHRFTPNRNQSSNRIGNTTINNWQNNKNTPRQFSRTPANDNAPTQKPNPPQPRQFSRKPANDNAPTQKPNPPQQAPKPRR
jgi:hypothetical protein